MNPEIILEDYKLFNLLGKGNFGEVYLTKKGNDPKYLASKRLDLKIINPSVKQYLDNEIEIMKQLNHPNIIHLVDFYQSSKHYYVIMEYCNGGTLTQCLHKRRKPFPIDVIQHITRQIVEGLKYIHSKRIIHRDLKLDNILVNFKDREDKNNLNLLAAEIKIIDFGLSKLLNENELADSIAGSPINMDPLILRKYNNAGGYEKLKGYDEKVDIWSLGTMVYEMVTGKALYSATTLKELTAKVEKGDYYLPTNMNLSKEFISFINGMLQYNGEKRLSAEELSKHDFLVKNISEFTTANLYPILDKIDGNNLVINSKKNSTISQMFGGKKEEENYPEWEAYINGLLAEYKAAKEYFRKNNLPNQEKIANHAYIKIQKIKVQYDLKNYSYLKSLPTPITQEFIYGYSTEKRNQKYNDILSKVINDKIKLEAKLKSYDKNAIQFNEEIKLEYEQALAQLEVYKNNVIKVENTLNKIWSPAPEYTKETKEHNIEKECTNNILKLEIKKVNSIKESINLTVELKYKEIILHNKKLNLNKNNNYSDIWKWTISAKDWVNIDDFYIKIVKDCDGVNNTSIIKAKINIGKVKNGKGITCNNILSQGNEENKDIINTTVIPEIFEGKKYFVKKREEIVNIKIYPEFNGKSPDTKNIPNFIVD